MMVYCAEGKQTQDKNVNQTQVFWFMEVQKRRIHAASAIMWVNKSRNLQWATKLESRSWQLERKLIQMEMT